MTTITAMASTRTRRIRAITMTTSLRGLAAAIAALGVCVAAFAQDFPSKPIKVIVPYAAGGGADILARFVGQQLGERLKQPVVVENRGSSSHTIGMSVVAASAKDGYPLGLPAPVVLITPAPMKRQPFDPP